MPTTPAGSMSMPMGARKRHRVPLKPRKHVKYEGVQPGTLHRYRKEVRAFFQYLHDFSIPLPGTLSKLDYELSEYINHLYQDDMPLNYGNDAVSGLKRLFPQCRRHLDLSELYMRNWRRAVHRVRAVPLHFELAQGIAGAAILLEDYTFAAVLLTGYLGLLRSSEMHKLRPVDFAFFGAPHMCVVTLKETKTGKRANVDEHVQIYDRGVLEFLKAALAVLPPGRGYSAGRLAGVGSPPTSLQRQVRVQA